MITTVCMNPCFDKTATVNNLVLGEVNRIQNFRVDLGGKGINVAVVLQRLGAQVKCIGCVGEASVPEIEPYIKAEGLCFDYQVLPGHIRTNMKVVDPVSKKITEFNEVGLSMTERELESFLVKLHTEAADSDYVVLSGSLPSGCDTKTYRKCLNVLQGKKCILDAAGENLLYGISENPFLVKPNLHEIEGIMKKDLRTLRAIRDAAMVLMNYGAQNVIVSMGKYGAMLVCPDHSYFSPALMVEAKSTVGAGDSMIGGILAGLTQGMALPEAFRCGVAAGAACVMTEGTQLIRMEDYEQLLPKVMVQEV